jgi:NAD(P)-dependent dehydrogenase (short-subunit alcohol dehydrogenase family)
MTADTRHCVVSGGGSGMGKAITRILAGDGCLVVIVGRRKEVLEKTALSINHDVGTECVSWHSADLTKPVDISGAVEAITAHGDPVDVLVNCAGGYQGQRAGDATLAGLDEVIAHWQQNFTANVLPTVLFTRALVPHLRRPGGRVLAIGSMAVFRGHSRRAAYGSAKAAVHAWACALAGDLAPAGITVNVIAPGRVLDPASEAASRLTDELQREAVREIPAGRLGTPEDIAAAARYLVSPGAGYITGQIIQVNGGMVPGRG